MRSIGVVTTALMVSLASFAIVIGVKSIPDIKRYLKIRSM
ncbi:DUF6893 family small protein [Arthrobacter sp. H14]